MSDNSISFREYREEIEFIVDVIEERLADNPDAELSELVFEEIDSHQWVIYNGYHTDVLSHTEPDEWKHFIGDDSDYREVLQAMTFSAMRKDVWEEIHDRGLEE